MERRARGKRKLAQTHPEVLGRATASPKGDRGRAFRVKESRLKDTGWEGPSCPVQLRDPARWRLRVCSGAILARPVPGE